MRIVLLLAVFVLLFVGCGADEPIGSGVVSDVGTLADALESVGDSGECVGEGCCFS